MGGGERRAVDIQQLDGGHRAEEVLGQGVAVHQVPRPHDVGDLPGGEPRQGCPRGDQLVAVLV